MLLYTYNAYVYSHRWKQEREPENPQLSLHPSFPHEIANKHIQLDMVRRTCTVTWETPIDSIDPPYTNVKDCRHVDNNDASTLVRIAGMLTLLFAAVTFTDLRYLISTTVPLTLAGSGLMMLPSTAWFQEKVVVPGKSSNRLLKLYLWIDNVTAKKSKRAFQGENRKHKRERLRREGMEW